MAAALIEVEDLTVHRDDGSPIVSTGVSFELRAGECVALVGESGSGKSVTARSLLGLAGEGLRVDAAKLRLHGRDALSFTEKDWRAARGAQIGLVLQDALVSLDPLRTIGNEVIEPIEVHGTVPRHQRRQRVLELLSSVGIPDPERRIGQFSHQLSGGQRQRALIASALAGDAPILIADEPTTALDVRVQRQVLDLLRERKSRGTGLILISHDLAVVSQIADRILVLQDGEVREAGPRDDVLLRPRSEYTQRLLAAVPSPESKGHLLSRFEGRHEGGFVREPAPAHIVSEERILDVRHLTKHYAVSGGRRGGEVMAAVDDVSFEVRRGETVGIVGESGSGKSTTLKIILGLLEPTAGEVLLEGEPWSAVPERSRRERRSRIQLISQDPLSSFDPRYDVRRVIAESLASSVLGPDERERRVLEVLNSVGLRREIADQIPSRLSGGQRQRVAIARALAPTPSIIACDEPVSALDVSVQAQVLDLLQEIQASTGATLLFVSHDLGVIHHVSDRVLVMNEGKVVESGDVGKVFENPQHEYTRSLIDAIPGRAVLA